MKAAINMLLASNHTPALAHLARVRVSGVLSADAQIFPTAGRDAHALLLLEMQVAHGLPYSARVDLGTDVADYMNAEADLPLMRRGAFVSVAGDALELRHDHGHASLRVLNARDAVVFSGPINPTTDPRKG